MLRHLRRTGRKPARRNQGDIHETALRMLAQRALSIAEITERLQLREFAPSAVREELHRLERAGLVDESGLARAVCQAQLRAGRGRRAVVAALRRRKLAREAAAQALDEAMEGEESAALAAAFARATAKYRLWRRLPEQRRKVLRYLITRGFSLDDARRAMHEDRRDETHGRQTDDPGDPSNLP
jgi:regulatory protein